MKLPILMLGLALLLASPARASCGSQPCLPMWGEANNIGGAMIFFSQKKCVDANGKTLIGVSPLDGNPACVRLEYIRSGEPLPYHKGSDSKGWLDDVLVKTPRGIVAVTAQCAPADVGTGCLGVRGVTSNLGDIYLRSPVTVTHFMSSDEGHGRAYLVNDTCTGTAPNYAAALDANAYLDIDALTTSSGLALNYGTAFSKIYWPQACSVATDSKAGFGWYMGSYPYLLGNGVMSIPVLTLVHTEFNDKGNGHNCHLEQQYFTAVIGKVRHESYFNKDCDDGSDEWQHLQNKHDSLAKTSDCSPLVIAPPVTAGNWLEYQCGQRTKTYPPITATGDRVDAAAILRAGNMTSFLYAAAPTDNPVIASISPPSIRWHDTTTQITLLGTFPTSTLYGSNVKVMGPGGADADVTSSGGTTVHFTFDAADYDGGLQCGANDLQVLDGISSSPPVTLTVNC